ncbi:MAG: MYG1 family protein [Bacilli bacterium]|nr:MYG1 family protein [Bacilli bacterium]
MIKVVDKIEEANCITHSGTMHADEVFSTAFLDLYLENVKVFRTAKVEGYKIREDQLVYDIGRGKFDHHQQDALRRDNNIPYCSFGLLWKEYGKEFLKKYDILLIDKVFTGIDKDLVEGIDADDNGVFPKIEAPYRVKTIPNVIKIFNPSYDSGQIESEQFEKACKIARDIIEEEVYYMNGKVQAEEEIMKQLEGVGKDSHYLLLDKFLPYEETILQTPEAENLYFVAYPSNRGGYAIKVVPKSLEDRIPRLPFPEEWAGLEGEELEEVSKITGLSFCHSGRFIVTCKTLDAVYKVLEKILVDC